jgi:hypothetical protein
MSGILDISGYYDPTSVGKITFGPAPLLTAAPQFDWTAVQSSKKEIVCNALPPRYMLVVKADSNDADYLTATSFIEMEDLPLIRRWADNVKGKRHQWDTRWEYREEGDDPETVYAGLFTEEEFERIARWVPHGDYGVHSIEHIWLFGVFSEERLV